MKGPGLFSMLQIAAGLSMAGPMFVVGFEFVRTDRIVAGVGFLLLGAVALYFPTYVIDRIGGPRTWIRRRVDRFGETDDEPASDAEPVENGRTSEEDSRRSGPLSRFLKR